MHFLAYLTPTILAFKTPKMFSFLVFNSPNISAFKTPKFNYEMEPRLFLNVIYIFFEVGIFSRTPYLLQGSRFLILKRMRMGYGVSVREIPCSAGRAGATCSCRGRLGPDSIEKNWRSKFSLRSTLSQRGAEIYWKKDLASPVFFTRLEAKHKNW